MNFHTNPSEPKDISFQRQIRDVDRLQLLRRYAYPHHRTSILQDPLLGVIMHRHNTKSKALLLIQKYNIALEMSVVLHSQFQPAYHILPIPGISHTPYLSFIFQLKNYQSLEKPFKLCYQNIVRALVHMTNIESARTATVVDLGLLPQQFLIYIISLTMSSSRRQYPHIPLQQSRPSP